MIVCLLFVLFCLFFILVVDLLEKMFDFDIDKRFIVKEVFVYLYLEIYVDLDDEVY